jgi:preprotein translocase subunit SecE
MYTAAIILILAGMNAGFYGLDYFLMWLYRKYWGGNPFPKGRI